MVPKRLVVVLMVFVLGFPAPFAAAAEGRRLTLSQYRDRMKGGWIGQIIGVGWALPTEFDYPSRIIPAEEVPEWKPGRIDQHFNDDIYLNIRLLEITDAVGLDATEREAALEWIRRGGRRGGATFHGRNGVAPPDLRLPRYSGSGKWSYANLNMYGDWAGLVAPGMPGRAAELIDRFVVLKCCETRYDGRFTAALYAEAFFEDDVEALVRAALEVVPPESQYAEAVRDVLRWHRENPDDWQAIWRRIQGKYFEGPDYLHGLDPGPGTADAKIHGAYLVLGLLYGEGDLARTTVITMRCGQDSDCSASNAAGVVGTMLGAEAIPEKYTRKLDLQRPFNHVGWNLRRTFAASERLARHVVKRSPGRVAGGEGEEVWEVQETSYDPGPYLKWWDPPEPTGSRFTMEEMRTLEVVGLNWALEHVLTGWQTENARWSSGLAWEQGGRRRVLILEPNEREEAIVLRSSSFVPDSPPSKLALAASAEEPWMVAVRVDGTAVAERRLTGEEPARWTEITEDLRPWCGEEVLLEIELTPPPPRLLDGKKRRHPPAVKLAGLDDARSASEEPGPAPSHAL